MCEISFSSKPTDDTKYTKYERFLEIECNAEQQFAVHLYELKFMINS